eukprot:scaffold20758_cov74-Cyclotella_meneghiniana.AAC.5
MAKKTLLLSTATAAITAAAGGINMPLHLQNENKASSQRPRRQRTRSNSSRRTSSFRSSSQQYQQRILTSEQTRQSQNNSTKEEEESNDFLQITLELGALLPQTSRESTLDLPLAPRIINGIPAPSDRYPYAASLIHDEKHVCGGTLIAPDVILTAGHCSGFFNLVQIGGRSNDGDDDDSGSTTTNNSNNYDVLLVESHAVHPDYGNVIQSDFALAKLYGRSYKPVISLNTDNANTPVNDEYLTVMGYGVTVEGIPSTQSNVLREVDVQYMSNTECDASSGYYGGDYVTYEGYIEENMMCCHSLNRDACQGDSGGPIVRKGMDNTADLQVGIVSWGLGCAMDTFPGVYSRISAEYDWIRENVCQLSKYPPASFGCITTLEAASLDEKEEITLVMELDGRGQDTSWILEADGGSNNDSFYIQGTSYVPFGTYDDDGENNDGVAVEYLKVTPNQSYRWTVMDRMGGGSSRSSSKFRMCRGTVSAEECLGNNNSSNSNNDDDENNSEQSLVICGANGLPSSTRSIACEVEAQTPAPTPIQIELPVPVPVPVLGGRLPTFAPFFVPLFFETRQPLNRQDGDEMSSPAPTVPLMKTLLPTLVTLESDDDDDAIKTLADETVKTAVENEDTRESSIVTANANAESNSSSSLRQASSIRCALIVYVTVVAVFVVSCV